jgi:hypothetical protein
MRFNSGMNAPAPHKPHPKSKFTAEEDSLLRRLVSQLGEESWPHIAQRMHHRNARQCKERWTNYLSPSVSNSPWTPQEDRLLEDKIREIGQKWVQIAAFFARRTDIHIKNRYHLLCRRGERGADQPIEMQPPTVTSLLDLKGPPAGGARVRFPPLAAVVGFQLFLGSKR